MPESPALAQAGAAVIANYDSSKEAAEAFVQNIIAEGGRALAVQADISKAEDTKRLIDSAVKEFGRLKRTLLGVALALIYRVIFSLSYIPHLGSGEFSN